jgi:hypothetical protein
MTTADLSEAPTLLLPPGWAIDPLVVDRLTARLADCETDTVAAVAPLSTTPSGASYRTHAERLCLQPGDAAFLTDAPVQGAALVRLPDRCAFADGIVRATSGRLLVDPGATVHDAMGTTAIVASATAEGRSPFPRRPLVLFIGIDHDLGVGVWARNLVNALLATDVEARLAVATRPGGPHLTGPCLPTADTVRALRPDVVVTLDDDAADAVPEWCDQRSTVIVHHTGERTLTAELVSWRIGDADGRLRALLGRAVDPGELAALVSRLTSGPMPIAPLVDEDGELLVAPPTKRPATRPGRREVTVVRPSNRGGARLDAFVAEAAALGARARTVTSAAVDELIEHDVVMLSEDVDVEVGSAIALARSRVGRKTIVDVTRPTVPELAAFCAAATASREAVHDALEAAGIPVRMLPPLVTRSRLDFLRGARVELEPDDQRVLGLRIDSDESRQIDAVTRAIVGLLAADPEIAIECVGLVDQLPSELSEHPRVAVMRDLPADQAARWRVQAWIGSHEQADRVGRPTVLTESAYLGVPTVFSERNRGDIDDGIIGRFIIDAADDAERWLESLREVLAADPVPMRAALATRADLLFGPKAGMSIVNRIMGWAGFTRTWS